MEFKQYLAIIWHRIWLILLGVLLCGAIAYFINSTQQPKYVASTRLLIKEGGNNNNSYQDLLTGQRKADTYTELFLARDIAEKTIETLGLPYTADQLRSNMSVSSAGETLLIDVSITDTNPEQAALIANTMAKVFVEANDKREFGFSEEERIKLEAQKADVADKLEATETQINTLTVATAEDEALQSRLLADRNALQIQYQEIERGIITNNLETAITATRLSVIDSAIPNPTPISPRTASNTLLAALLGGLLGLGVIFLMEYLDDSVRSTQQVAEMTGLSTLGVIAQIEGDTQADRLISFRAPRAPISEAYRVIRTNLNFSTVDKELSSMLVTSSSPGEGKSTTSANIAVVMAQTGKRVILVDADLRRPTQHKSFETMNSQGLTTALLDAGTPIERHIQPTKVPGLRILTSGPMPPNPSELLNSQRMVQVMSTLDSLADVIIYDTPPALTVADASILAPRVDGCLVVLDSGKTKTDAIAQCADVLRSTGANLFGVVMNRIQTSGSRYYDYYKYRYYSYEYTQDNKKKQKGGLLGRLGFGK